MHRKYLNDRAEPRPRKEGCHRQSFKHPISLLIDHERRLDVSGGFQKLERDLIARSIKSKVHRCVAQFKISENKHIKEPGQYRVAK